MHDEAVVARAISDGRSGLSASEISRRTGVPRSTVRGWLAGSAPRSIGGCPSCGGLKHRFEDLPTSYVYLLGLYLGDGCISAHPRGVYKLRISLEAKYSGIIDQCSAAIEDVTPANKVNRRFCPQHCAEVYAYSRSWPCLLPQHGVGKKHERRISLTHWQQALVDSAPEALLRGLIHSDGCRFQNTGRGWSAPRYSFSTLSDDIKDIFCEACGQFGVHWTRAGRKTIYISRTADVARLDKAGAVKA